MPLPEQVAQAMHPGAISLGKLVHDSAQNAYRDLHGLMDSLPDRSSAERRVMLLDFAQKVRHRVLRILVIVRWAMDYASTVERADHAVAIAMKRAETFTGAADMLYHVRNAVCLAGSEEKLVAAAAEVLSTGNFERLPRIISRSINLSEELAGDEADSLQRLGVMTRGVLKVCLPIAGEVRVLKWRPDQTPFATQIGVFGSWRADVAFNQLDASRALLGVFSVKVMIGSQSDASSAHDVNDRTSMSRSQERILVRLCNERIRAAAESVDAGNQSLDGRDGKPVSAIARTTRLLEALRDFMGPEVCAPLAMEHLFQHSADLSRGPLKETFKFETMKTENPEKPLIVHYWRHHRRASQLRIQTATTMERNSADSASFTGTPAKLLTITHVPAMDASAAKTIEMPQMNALDLERLLVSSMRARSLTRLARVHKQLVDDPDVDAQVQLHVATAITIVIRTKTGSGGIELRIDQKLGCIRGRIFDATAYFDKREALGLAGISGNFRTDEEEIAAVKDGVKKTLETLSVREAMKTFRAADIGAMMLPPPGARPKLTQPPYVPVETKRPRSFASLVRSRPDPSNAHTPQSSAMQIEELSNWIFCAQVESSRVGGITAATRWLQRAQYRLNALRLGRLLRAHKMLAETFEWTAASGTFGWYDVSGLQTRRLPIVNSSIIVTDKETWQVRLTTSHPIFDRSSSTRWGASRYVSYNNSTLTFSYPVISREAISTFAQELRWAQTMMTVSDLLPRETTFYNVVRRTPLRMMIEIRSPSRYGGGSAASDHTSAARQAQIVQVSRHRANEQTTNGVASKSKALAAARGGAGMPGVGGAALRPQVRPFCRVVVEFGSYPKKGFRVTFLPETKLNAQLAYLMEEVLDSAEEGEQQGIALAGLLERSCSVAAVAERVLVGVAKGKAVWLSAVRLRAFFPEKKVGTSSQQYYLEVDVRMGSNVALKDLGKEAELRSARCEFVPVAGLSEVIEQMSSNNPRSAQMHRERASVAIVRLQFLEEFLSKLVASTRR